MTPRYISFITVLLLASIAQAMPLSPESISRLRASGQLANVAAQEQAAARLGQDQPIQNILPSLRAMRGRDDPNETIVHMPVIIVDFEDNQANQNARPREHYEDLIFSEGQYRTGSVHDYYLETSYGEVQIVGQVAGWVRAPQTYAYYVNGQGGNGAWPQNVQRLVYDALDQANETLNYRDFDNDGNGTVEGVLILHAGSGAEANGGDANMIWSHAWTLGNHRYRADGVTVSNYCIVPEDCEIGVVGHEMGHLYFGLPDLYDRDYTSQGLGMWTMMAAGSWGGGGVRPVHFDAWCKLQLGWIDPTVPNENIDRVDFPPVETHPTIYQLWNAGNIGRQYFLVENRQRTGFDGELPGSGLCIYHVDETVGGNQNDNEWYPGHQANGHYLVALEQADGQWHIEQNANYGDAGDVYPGAGDVREFGDRTTPNSRSYGGQITRVSVKNPQNGNNGHIFADLEVGLGGQAPDIYLDQGELNFGEISMNTTRDLGLTVTNTGHQDLEVESVEIVGADFDHFSIVDGGGAFNLGFLESRDMTIRFNPTAIGNLAAQLEFISNDPDESPRDVNLLGAANNLPTILEPSMEARVTMNFQAGRRMAIHFRAVVPDNGPMTWTATNRGRLPDAAQFTDHGDGTADLTYDAPAGQSARFSPTFTVTDDENQTDVIQLLIAVNINRPPAFNPPPLPPEIYEDDPRLDVASLDSLFLDADGDSLTYELIDHPATLSPILDLGILSVEPARDFNTYDGVPIRLAATDPAGLRTEGTLVVVVVPVNDPPGDFSLASPANNARMQDLNVPFIWHASPNVDGDSIFYRLRMTIAPRGDLTEDGILDSSVHFSRLTADYLRAIGADEGAAAEWWVEAYDAEWTMPSTEHFHVTLPSLSVEPDPTAVPTTFVVNEPYPNPFNSTVRIQYAIPSSARVSVGVYDLKGNLVETLVNGQQNAGIHRLNWNGDAAGRSVPGGIYLIRIAAGTDVKIVKAALVR